MILFVVGPPGAGKTTFVRELLGLGTANELPGSGYLVPKPKWTVLPETRACAAGHYTGETFDGGDTVPYTGAKDALEYWHAHLSASTLTVFDGDRFSNEGVLETLRRWGHVPVCLHLDLAESDLARRRAARGSSQNASWMKGRGTKASRFAEKLPALTLMATSPARDLVATTRAWLPKVA